MCTLAGPHNIQRRKELRQQILIKYEVDIMKYSKPAAAIVGFALDTIGSTNKLALGSNDNIFPKPNGVTVTAYEADE